MILELNNRESKSSLHSTVVNCVWWECKYISQTVLDQKDIMMLYGAKVHQGTHFFFQEQLWLAQNICLSCSQLCLGFQVLFQCFITTQIL